MVLGVMFFIVHLVLFSEAIYGNHGGSNDCEQSNTKRAHNITAHRPPL